MAVTVPDRYLPMAKRMAELEQQCAAMRAALEKASHELQYPDTMAVVEKALSTNAGKGWVSPEEHEAALKEAYENVRKRGEQVGLWGVLWKG